MVTEPETLPQVPAFTVVSTVVPLRTCTDPVLRALATDFTVKLDGTALTLHVANVSDPPPSELAL